MTTNRQVKVEFQTAKFEFAHDASYKLYADGRFFNVAKDDLEKSPLADAALDDTARAAKTKLQALLKQHEGPRDAYFVNQAQGFKGEAGEDANGNKVPKKGEAKKSPKPAAPANDAQARISRFEERDANHDGKISFDEFMTSASDKVTAKERFWKYDTDKDDSLTRDEFIKQGMK